MTDRSVQLAALAYLAVLFTILGVALYAQHERLQRPTMDAQGCYVWSDGQRSCRFQGAK